MPVDFTKNPEQLLANATNFLIEGQEFKEASLLLLCQINVSERSEDNYRQTELVITLTCNRTVYDLIQDYSDPSTVAIRKAFEAVLPYDYSVGKLSAVVQFSDDFDTDWRARMLEMIEGKSPLEKIKRLISRFVAMARWNS